MEPTARVLRLYPPPCEERPLRGLYLEQGLREVDSPLVYTNFIASLDGRVSEPDPVTRLRRVPLAIANERDWRLYLELAAQADALLTTARHLRAVAANRHTDLLALDADLVRWRTDRGLSPMPEVVALSLQLDLPAELLAERLGARLRVVTGAMVDPAVVQRLERAGIEVLRTASVRPGGREVVNLLSACGFACIYSIAGPRVHHFLLADGALDRLYLTLANRIVSGEDYDTLVEGYAFEPHGFSLSSLYLDPAAFDGAGQLFMAFRKLIPPPP